MLVVKQLNAEWSCKSPRLKYWYERGLELVRLIKACSSIDEFHIEHVYREYNSSADSLANEAISQAHSLANDSDVIINENWFQMQLDDATQRDLRSIS